jgi:hypothetical protein
MASAILTVLWPKQFTVYDVRVCEQLKQAGFGDYKQLTHRRPHRIWDGYRAFRAAVCRATPISLSLREKDNYLWGRSAAEQLLRDIEQNFGARPRERRRRE